MRLICRELVDQGPTRVRGYHDFSECFRDAKYVAKDEKGNCTYLCGIHARVWRRWHNDTIEKLED